MKVLFLNPPNFSSQYIHRDLMGGLGVNVIFRKKIYQKIMSYLYARCVRLPVLSLAYSATVLSKYCDVVVLDAANLELSEEETILRIEKEKPDWILSSTTISMLRLEANLLSTIKKRCGVPVGLMGDAATLFSLEILEKYPIDFILLGNEPEFVIEKMGQKQGYENIQGVAYRKNGKIEAGSLPPLVQDLDSLPFPKWDLFPVKSFRFFPMLRPYPVLPMLSTRGCPYGCVYCPYPSNQGLKYRARSAQNVIDEMHYLSDNYQVKAVLFRDPTFTLNKDRTKEICKGIIGKKLKIEWGCETRPDCLDEELINTIAEAGCKAVNIGLESFDPEIIRNMKRGWIDPARIQKLVQCMLKCGIRVSGFFIFGLPGESRKTVRNTMDFVSKLPLTYADFKVATPFPGTPLFEMAKEREWINEIKIEQYTSTTPSMHINEEIDSEFLEESTNRAYRSFYMRPAKIIRELSSDSFIPLLFTHLSG